MISKQWKLMHFMDCIEKVKAPSKIQKKQYLSEGKYPIISQDNSTISGYWNNSDDLYAVEKSLVVFGDHTCALKFIDFDFVVGADGIKILKPKEFLDAKFFFYQLLSFNLQPTGYARHFRKLKEHMISIPPLEEQQRIVSILDEAFETLVEKTQQINSRLSSAKELFGSYLSDLFSKKHQGWEEKKVGEVVTLQGGSQPPKAVFSAENLEGYIRLIQIRDYKSDKHIVYIPKEKARRFCNKEDIMIGRYGPPLFQILRGIEGSYNVALMKAIPDEQYLTKNLLYYFLQNRDLLRYIERSSSRTAGQTGFKKETLESYTITYPKFHEQQLQLVEKLDELKENTNNIVANFEREIHMIEELRQSMLQEAFNGNLAKEIAG